jgi:hypothetical protein
LAGAEIAELFPCHHPRSIGGDAMLATYGRTTLLHLDHMNDYKGYTKLLQKWCSQLRLGGVIFLSLHCDPRPRHVFAVLDSPMSLGGTGEFLTRLRTQNVDVNMRGQPCRERMSTVIADLPRGLPMPVDGVGTLVVVETEGAKGSQTHMPFVRQWLLTHRPADATTLIAAMDAHLDATTKPGKRR